MSETETTTPKLTSERAAEIGALGGSAGTRAQEEQRRRNLERMHRSWAGRGHCYAQGADGAIHRFESPSDRDAWLVTHPGASAIKAGTREVRMARRHVAAGRARWDGSRLTYR